MKLWSDRRAIDVASPNRHAFECLESRRMLAASIASVTPYNGQQSVGVSSNVLIAFGSAMTNTTLTASRFALTDPSGTVVPTSLSYNATTHVLTLDPTPTLAANTGYYTVRVAGGSAGVKASDGSTLPADYVMSFTCGTPNIGQQTVFSGLNNPTNIEFSPDGRIYIAEKSGVIKLFDSLTDTTPTQVADFRTSVHNFWDRGLLGMALDPNFTTGRPYIYVLYTYDGSIGGASPTWGTVGGTDDGGGTNPTGTGAPVSARLSRFAVNAAGVMTGSEQILIADWNQQFPSHSIGDLKFGPDGYLYASGGDGANFNNVDYGQVGNPFSDPVNEGGALRSQDILTDGDPAGLNGSIIRIDPNTGAAAPNNPFSTSGDANKRKIIANGLRNPFRITFKPGTKELYIAETGWNDWEEINRIPDVTDNVAENFGWPAYEGMGKQPAYAALNLPLLQSLYASNSDTKPWFTYAHTAQIVSGTDEPTGGSTPTGVAFYQGGNYPSAFNGALFFADYARSRIYVMYVGPDGQINQASRQIVGVGGAVELTTGPGGDIFAVNLALGTVTRLVATGYNSAPIARIVANKTSGAVPLTVAFDATTSTDPENNQLWYAWDLNGDGQFDDSFVAKPTWTYSAAQSLTIRLRVTDPGGLSSTASLAINAANTAPVPTISTPLTTLHWKVGDTINFAGSATDAEEGTLSASHLSWSLVLIHANAIDPTSTHEHTITGFNGVASGSFVAPDHEYPSWLELRLTATDSLGLATTTSLRIDPRTVVLTFQTSPNGMQLVVNSATLNGNTNTTVIVGSCNSITAPPNQTLAGTPYAFDGWNFGGAASQTIIAPATDTVYIARYSPVPTGTSPAVPSGLGAAIQSGPQVKLNWTDNSNNETSFVFQRRYAGWIWEDLATTAAANVTTAIDVTAIGNVTYEYRVASKNSIGQSAWSDVVVVNTAAPATQAAPAAPSALSATPVTSTRIDLSWQDNSGNETGFRVERRLPGGTFALVAIAAANARLYSDTTVAAGTMYEYRVLATDGTLTSAPSNAATATTPGGTVVLPAAPTNLALTVLANKSVSMTWADNATNESSYLIQRRYRGWIWEDITTIGANATSYVDASTIGNVAYEYRVIATNAAGQSGASNIVEALIPGA